MAGKSEYAKDIGALKVSVGVIETTLSENLPRIREHLKILNGRTSEQEMDLALAKQLQDLCPWTETTPGELKAEIKEEVAEAISNSNGLPIDLGKRSHKAAVGGGLVAAAVVVLNSLNVLWETAKPILEPLLEVLASK